MTSFISTVILGNPPAMNAGSDCPYLSLSLCPILQRFWLCEMWISWNPGAECDYSLLYGAELYKLSVINLPFVQEHSESHHERNCCLWAPYIKSKSAGAIEMNHTQNTFLFNSIF